MKKRISRLLAVMMVVTSIFTYSGFAQEPLQTKLTIIHTNDTHSNVSDNGKDVIGFAKLATYVENLKMTERVLFVDAGDMFQGLPYANLEKGQSVVPVANLVGYDAMAVGNHEFDFGSSNLMDISKQINFPMLAANIYKDGKQVFPSYIVKEIGGLKVGVFGISTPETTFKTHPDNVVGYEFRDIIANAQKTVKELRETEKVDVVVMLSHLGLYEGDYTSDKVASAVEGIDVIIDGHSHTKLDEGMVVGNTLIASANTALKNVGKVEVTLADAKVIDKKASLLAYADFANTAPKAAINDEIAKITKEQDKVLSKVVGKTSADLGGERGVVRTGESNLGQLATDAMLDLTGAQVAITNGGGIRTSIKAGDITMKDLVTVFPFGNTLMVKQIKGSDIVAALEHGTSDFPVEKGAFPHVAGMTFTLNGGAKAGERITDVKVAGVSIDMNKTYSVVTNDFMAVGGDGYEMLKPYSIDKEYNTLMDTLLGYIEKTGEVQGDLETRITVRTEGEIRIFAQAQGFKVDFNAKTKEIKLTKEGAVVQFKANEMAYQAMDADSNIAAEFKYVPTIKDGRTYVDVKEVNSILVELTKAA
ncbi:MAG: 5'-nucleotidase C-terminal domain-containing protein [Proteocatella sp.]